MIDRLDPINEQPQDDLFDELHGLITARFSEQITLEQLKRLEHLIINNQEARQIYLLYVHDLTNLRRMLRANAANAADEGNDASRELDALRESILARRLNVRGKAAAGAAAASEAETIAGDAEQGALSLDAAGNDQGRKRLDPTRSRAGWKAAGLALLLGGIIAAVTLLRSSPPASLMPHVASEAVLADTLDAAWEDDQGRSVTVPTGQPLGPRRLRLVRGVATISMGGDIVVLLDGREAATSFEIQSDGGARLHFGRLTLRSNPKSAATYALNLPGNIRLTQGTEFGVVVDEQGRSEVHVIEGFVDAMQLGDDGSVSGRTRIAPRTAVIVRPATRAAPIEMEESVFDRGQFLLQQPDKTLEETTRTIESAQQGAWRNHVAGLRADPALVFYMDGASSGLGEHRLVPGRFEAGPAVGFRHAQDQLVVADDPALQLADEMTVAVWLNPDRARTQGFALIVGKGTGGGGGVTAENRNYTLFLAPSAAGQPRFEFSINEQGTDDNRHIQAGVVGARQWHLVVGVVRQGRMYLYCNGRLAADPLPIQGPKISDEPLLIGRSQHPQIQSPFQGAIDMIAILNRGMTDAEIQSMYRAGRP